MGKKFHSTFLIQHLYGVPQDNLSIPENLATISSLLSLWMGLLLDNKNKK